MRTNPALSNTSMCLETFAADAPTRVPNVLTIIPSPAVISLRIFQRVRLATAESRRLDGISEDFLFEVDVAVELMAVFAGEAFTFTRRFDSEKE